MENVIKNWTFTKTVKIFEGPIVYPGVIFQINQMTLYNPNQKRAVWCEFVARETWDQRRAYLQWNMPYGTKLTAEDLEKEKTYYNNNKEHKKIPIYDRFFDRVERYNQKLHRDDRATRIGLNVINEERKKDVPLLSSSLYGFKPESLETPSRVHAKVHNIQKQFFRNRGTNLPCRTTTERVMPD